MVMSSGCNQLSEIYNLLETNCRSFNSIIFIYNKVRNNLTYGVYDVLSKSFRNRSKHFGCNRTFSRSQVSLITICAPEQKLDNPLLLASAIG